MTNHRRLLEFQDQSVGSSLPLVSKAVRLADVGEYEEALRMLANGNSSSQEILNARGVCFMRLGRPADAVRVFRSLVLPSGCIWMKPELPVIYRTNFSTALLLAGLPLGVRDTLQEIAEKDHPSVRRLSNAVAQWERRMSWWQYLSWKYGFPPKLPLTIDFLPGEFTDTTLVSPPTSPETPSAPFPPVQQVA
ncbi:MAG: hypothetical protein KDA93_05570 [Planctomycetaceae bacterium]|nr:hypothetical protein [Planctomycetaceae bacterium]